MRQVNVHDAKTNLSRLLEDVAAGESFVIAKAGKPVARVVPIDSPNVKSRIGFLEDQIRVPDDFDRIGKDEIADMFEQEA